MTERYDLTPEEVAEVLKIRTNTVYELIKRGDLAAYRVGRKLRIEPSAVEDYKLQRREGSAAVKSATGEEKAAPVAARAPEYILCGQDIILDVLARRLEQAGDGIRVLREQAGSFSGLQALYEGRADMTAVHLWDADSREYNIPYVRRLLPGIPALLIHVAQRTQGFYVKKGNPLKIKGWEDLQRPELRLVNRESGSGTRVLLDEQLRRMGLSGQQISGYRQIEQSHLGVASAVARGLGDLGLGNQKAAMQVNGVAFVPLQAERYELVIRDEDDMRSIIHLLLSTLDAPGFRDEVAGLGDYNLAECGRIVARI